MQNKSGIQKEVALQAEGAEITTIEGRPERRAAPGAGRLQGASRAAVRIPHHQIGVEQELSGKRAELHSGLWWRQY